MKEKVLIFNCHTERSNMLFDSLLTKGYEVRIIDEHNPEEIQQQIHHYRPDYVVMEDDELIALTGH